jgi:hypothetical protein
LLHLSFGLKEYGATFCMMVAFTAMIHPAWRFICKRTSASAWLAASLAILVRPLIKGSLIYFFWKWSKVLLPVFRWPTTIGINVVYWGSCTDCHCNGLALKLHCFWVPFFAARVCESVRPPILNLVNCSYNFGTIFGRSLTK